jgi:hypothetical protein
MSIFAKNSSIIDAPVSARRGSKSLAWTYGNSGLRRFVLLAAKAVVVVYVILDGIVRPIFRPLLRWVSRLRFVIRLQDIVAALPPYAILVCERARYDGVGVSCQSRCRRADL